MRFSEWPENSSPASYSRCIKKLWNLELGICLINMQMDCFKHYFSIHGSIWLVNWSRLALEGPAKSNRVNCSMVL